MITLGIDIGSSSVKVTLFDADRGKPVATASYPPMEMGIHSPQPTWAEQDPLTWMDHLVQAMGLLRSKAGNQVHETAAIGLSYQMHGLVAVNKEGLPVRNAIIWCDSRAVEIGDRAFRDLGEGYCLGHLLNSPGNFTASKLEWVRQNEPATFERIHKVMLPGDYIAYRLTGEIRTTRSGLSEGIFWDFEQHAVSKKLLDHFGLSGELLPDLVDTFGVQGRLMPAIAQQLGMKPGTPVTYRAGDQPNNAFSLNVLNPGEVAANAGTSGVVYGVTDQKAHDPRSRVNTFLHVNDRASEPRLGVLLCLNGTGILNSWARRELIAGRLDYTEMNEIAAKAPSGSEGLLVMPFGNGAERMLANRPVEASFQGLNFNIHRQAHLLRALQEGIVFALTYGLEIMRGVGVEPRVIRAGKANMFLSRLFGQTLADVSGATIELFNTHGAEGAARGAAAGAGHYKDLTDTFTGLEMAETLLPSPGPRILESYQRWRQLLESMLV